MKAAARTFTAKPAVRGRTPLLLGVCGASGSGKTFSALRLATGIQRVTGGKIVGIDTEHRRMLHYADRFKFDHIDFEPPFGPLDYLAAIEQAVAQGGKVLVIDSMTHEHNGPGGVMDQTDEYLDRKAAANPEDDPEKVRQRHFFTAQKTPKLQRKRLNAAILHMGINAVFCYRAADKVKPVSGKEPLKLGWQPETTSPLVWDMVVRFLLPPGSDGHPEFKPDTVAEKLETKLPDQFKEWLQPGIQLTEDLGEKFARWAAGPEAGAASTTAPRADLATTLAACTDVDAWLTENAAELAKLNPKSRAAADKMIAKRRAALAAAREGVDSTSIGGPPEEYTPT